MAKKREPTAGGMRYVGDGSHIHGIPARNLSAEEAGRYRETILESQMATGISLYVEELPDSDHVSGSEPEED